MFKFIPKPIHISQIKAGDTVSHNDKIMTVSNSNLKRDSFIGITLFGDSYRLGYKPVTLLIYKKVKS